VGDAMESALNVEEGEGSGMARRLRRSCESLERGFVVFMHNRAMVRTLLLLGIYMLTVY